MTVHKKNEEYELKITDIGSEGEGIGHLDDGYTLFVQGALPGDTIRAHIIKAQKKYGIAKSVEIIAPSPDRVTPACPHAGDCGGPACPYFRREGAQCFQTLMQDAEAMIRAMASRIEQLERTTEK